MLLAFVANKLSLSLPLSWVWGRAPAADNFSCILEASDGLS